MSGYIPAGLKDKLNHEIANLLLKRGASGVRIMDGGVDALIGGRAIRVEVTER